MPKFQPDNGFRFVRTENKTIPKNPEAIQPKTFTTEKPINCQQAAELLAVHPKKIKRMAAARELPGHFRFGRWYFYASELDSWMKMELNSEGHP